MKGGPESPEVIAGIRPTTSTANSVIKPSDPFSKRPQWTLSAAGPIDSAMKLRPVILIILLVVLPIAALAGAAWKIAENEKLVVEKRYRQLMEARLSDLNITVSDYFADVQRDVQKLLKVDEFEPAAFREMLRNEPRLLQTFVLDSDGFLVYPDPNNALNSNEREFLLKSAKMFSGKDLRSAVMNSESRTIQGNSGKPAFEFSNQSSEDPSQVMPIQENSPLERSPFGNDAPQLQQSDVQQSDVSQQSIPGPVELSDRQTLRQSKTSQDSEDVVFNRFPLGPQLSGAKFRESSGWFVWYWDRGLNLISWQRRPSGHIVGAALQRARWMSDLVANLPDTVAAVETGDEDVPLSSRVRLINSSADTVYQWGTFEPDSEASAFCEIPLAAPLNSWRLQAFVPQDQLLPATGRGVYVLLLSSFLGVGLLVALAATVLVRDYARDMKEAQQQVSFVNQVSHELRTPLTNIRMYAELLEADLQHLPEEDRSKPEGRLNVILSEGQRLTRLIGNVLTFAQQKRDNLQLHRECVSPDDVINKVISRFQPALEDQQVVIQQQLDAEARRRLDPDFLEQILGNLINNVEKYAASGGRLEVRSELVQNTLSIDVIDDGPGISKDLRTSVFRPFVRGSNDVNYAAGTGIGLSIAQELCRLHEGELVLKDSETGCWFQATLQCEEC